MIIPILTFIIGFYLVILVFKKKQPTLHSHWNTLLDDFSYSPKEFYRLLREELSSRGFENITFHSKAHLEGGIASSRRLYLRLRYKNYYYDCCCAPVGTKNTFVSWWLVSNKTLAQRTIESIPLIGAYLSRIFFPVTYFTVDTMSMFMTYAQSSVLKVIDQITKDAGVRSIPDNERKPILSDVFKR